MDLSWANRPLFLRLKRASERPKVCISPVSTEDDDMSDANNRFSFQQSKPKARVRIISPEKEDLSEDGHRKPSNLQPPDDFSFDDDDDSMDIPGANKLNASCHVYNSGNGSKLSMKSAYYEEFIVWDETTKQFQGWADIVPLQRNGLPKTNNYLKDYDEDDDDAYADSFTSKSNSTSSEVEEDRDGDVNELVEEQLFHSDKSTDPVVTGDTDHDAIESCDSDIPLLDDTYYAHGAGIQPDQFNIEEWHGCRFDDDGKKEVYIKWDGYGKKQWLQDFNRNATEYAVEEFDDKCKRFPPCPSCSAGVPHTCWKIEEYVQCQGIFARKVVDGILQYKIKWLNDRDEWVVAGQFNESSWEKVEGMTKRIRCISCDRKDPNHTCLDNGMMIISSGLKAAVTYRPKARRKLWPPRAPLSSSRGKSASSKRKASSQTVKAKTKKQRTGRPRKAVEPPRNPAPFFPGGSPFQMGNKYVHKIQLSDASPERVCLADCFFENRLRPANENSQTIHTTILKDGETWKLLYAFQPKKAKPRIRKQKHFHQARTPTECYYVAVRDKHEESNLHLELEKLADFSMLKPEKVVARIKLLFTDAKKTGFIAQPRCIFTKPSSICGEIPERGNDGCGFFSKKLISELFDNEQMRTKFNKAVALQIRMVCPKFGIFKGMLMLKGSPSDYLVELPSSMKKVPPSKHRDFQDKAVILIKQTFPSQTNIALEKFWKTPRLATKTDREAIQEGLSKGIRTFLEKAFKVTESEWTSMFASSKKAETVQHANVVGVADPTEGIPPGTVYLSGFRNIRYQNKPLEIECLFVCRHPSVERANARRLPILTKKPRDMAQSQWSFLESLPFGVIVFGFDENMPAIPPQISSGDLDGDLYFVSWDQHLLRLDLMELNCRRISKDASEEPSNLIELESNPNWLESAYQLMTDAARMEMYGQLMGKFHVLWNNSTDEIDAAEFGLAYMKSLDIKTHGGKITLPKRSWEKLRPTLHCLLQEPEYPELTQILYELHSHALDDAERAELCRAYRDSLDVEANNGVIELPKRWWDNIPRRFHSLLHDEE